MAGTNTIFTSENKVYICDEFISDIIQILPEIDYIIEKQAKLKDHRLIFLK
jgi:hypothetical protein